MNCGNYSQEESIGMISVRNLVKTFGDFTAVKDITFDVAQGEIFAFLGPNGAGKTTTIKMIATLIQPTSGRVSIDGIDVVKHPLDVRPLLGYMPDFFGL